MSLNTRFSVPDPEWAAEVARQPKWEPSSDVIAVRKVINEFFIGVTKRNLEPQLPHDSTYRVVDHAVPVNGGGSTRVRTITPASLHEHKEDESFPCIVWIHGGGFQGGNLEFDDYRMRIIAVKYKITAALLEYRLAPEHHFPTSHRDAYDGLKWVAENAHVFSADLGKGFILGGTSAGGSLAASLTHRAQQDPFFEGRRLTGQILQVPSLCHPLGYPEEYRDELQSINMPEGREWTQLTRESLLDMFDNLLKVSTTNPEASPLLYQNRQVLPPTYLQIAGLDPLRDEGILYERLLKEAGVLTRITIYPGVPHGFHLAWPLLSASKKFEEDLRAGVEWLLSLQIGAGHAA